MRIPLANTLRNRQGNTTRDARLLNAVVDTRQRVQKRPSLVGAFGPVNIGPGLGLIVRNVPQTPDNPSSPELVAITGSVLTTNPSPFLVPTHVVNSQHHSDPPNNYYGFEGGVGGIIPTTLLSITINAIFSQNPAAGPAAYFYIYLANSGLSQSFFTYITSAYGTLTTAASDDFGHTGTQTYWGWSNTVYWGATTGSIPVAIV